MSVANIDFNRFCLRSLVLPGSGASLGGTSNLEYSFRHVAACQLATPPLRLMTLFAEARKRPGGEECELKEPL